MEDEYSISRGSALDERRGPHDESREILIKTPGNNSSLRLNAKVRKDHELMVWEVTRPFEEPLHLVKESNKWASLGKTTAAVTLIEAIGNAIDEQLSL